MYYLVIYFNAQPTTATYTLSLHDALPILCRPACARPGRDRTASRQSAEAPEGVLRGMGRAAHHRHPLGGRAGPHRRRDRKSTRLNSSHVRISYAVFCLKKKKITRLIYLHK